MICAGGALGPATALQLHMICQRRRLAAALVSRCARPTKPKTWYCRGMPSLPHGYSIRCGFIPFSADRDLCPRK